MRTEKCKESAHGGGRGEPPVPCHAQGETPGVQCLGEGAERGGGQRGDGEVGKATQKGARAGGGRAAGAPRFGRSSGRGARGKGFRGRRASSSPRPAFPSRAALAPQGQAAPARARQDLLTPPGTGQRGWGSPRAGNMSPPSLPTASLPSGQLPPAFSLPRAAAVTPSPPLLLALLLFWGGRRGGERADGSAWDGARGGSWSCVQGPQGRHVEGAWPAGLS